MTRINENELDQITGGSCYWYPRYPSPEFNETLERNILFYQVDPSTLPVCRFQSLIDVAYS